MELNISDYERFMADRFWQLMLKDIEERMRMLKDDWRKENPMAPDGAFKIASTSGQLNELEWIRELPNLILEDIQMKEERELVKTKLEKAVRGGREDAT